MTIGNGNKSSVDKSGWLAPTRFTAALCHFSNSLFEHAEIVCFNPFSDCSKSAQSRSGYIKFRTITAAKFSKPCDLIGTLISEAEFDKLPNSHTLQTCFCTPCPGPPVLRPNEYSSANVGFIVSDRSKKLLIIVDLPLNENHAIAQSHWPNGKLHKMQTNLRLLCYPKRKLCAPLFPYPLSVWNWLDLERYWKRYLAMCHWTHQLNSPNSYQTIRPLSIGC